MTMFGIHLFPLPKMFGFMFHVSRHMFSYHPPNLHINELISCSLQVGSHYGWCYHCQSLSNTFSFMSCQFFQKWQQQLRPNQRMGYIVMLLAIKVFGCLHPTHWQIFIDVVTWHGQPSVLDGLYCDASCHKGIWVFTPNTLTNFHWCGNMTWSTKCFGCPPLPILYSFYKQKVSMAL
jgi:hypothetical protein